MLKILTLNNVKYAECSNKCRKINNETIGAKETQTSTGKKKGFERINVSHSFEIGDK